MPMTSVELVESDIGISNIDDLTLEEKVMRGFDIDDYDLTNFMFRKRITEKLDEIEVYIVQHRDEIPPLPSTPNFEYEGKTHIDFLGEFYPPSTEGYSFYEDPELEHGIPIETDPHLSHLTDLIIGRRTDLDWDMIYAAVEFAAIGHDNQFRDKPIFGTDEFVPYLTHVVHAGYLMAELGFDSKFVAAGIMHDLLEDAQDPELIEASIIDTFGEDVKIYVEAVTKKKMSKKKLLQYYPFSLGHVNKLNSAVKRKKDLMKQVEEFARYDSSNGIAALKFIVDTYLNLRTSEFLKHKENKPAPIRRQASITVAEEYSVNWAGRIQTTVQQQDGIGLDLNYLMMDAIKRAKRFNQPEYQARLDDLFGLTKP